MLGFIYLLPIYHFLSNLISFLFQLNVVYFYFCCLAIYALYCVFNRISFSFCLEFLLYSYDCWRLQHTETHIERRAHTHRKRQTERHTAVHIVFSESS